MSMGYRGNAGEYNSISGSTQDAIVRDQQAALKAGFTWTPMGWVEKASSNFGSNSSSSFSKNANPSGVAPQLISANHNQQNYDPWSKYRGAAGDKLNANMNSGDPSDIYRQRLETMLTGNGADFATSDPSYRFRYEQGKEATERSLASNGLLSSGNAAAAMSDYGQQSASQEFQAQFGRLMEGMSGVSKQYDVQQQRLMQMAGINNDPATAAKLNLQTEGINTDRMNSANTYNLGLQQDATNRYGVDVGAATTRGSASYRNSGGGGGGSIDTQSLYAGSARSAVESANWWDAQENKSSSLSYVGAAKE